MKDVQSLKDQRGIKIDRIGITDLKWPIKIKNFHKKTVTIPATISLSTNLIASQKGLHISRLVESLNFFINKPLSMKSAYQFVKLLSNRIESSDVYFNLTFTDFKKKSSPITRKKGFMNYECSLIANLKGNKIVIGLKINVPIFLLCPCSLAICRNGAHNQRGIVNLLIIPHKNDWFGDFINLVEKAGSAELYSILKRSDEKFLIDSATEKAFFVEDVARNIIVILKKNGYNSYRLEVKSFESIHNHNIYSRIGLNENELPS